MQHIMSRVSRALVILSMIGMVGFSRLQAADFSIDAGHSSVGFSVRHFVSQVKGSFGEFTGTFSYDAQKPEQSKVEATIQTKTVNTNLEKRDEHLRAADFFNVEKFPTMTFKSTAVKKTGPNKLEVTGNLTLLGITKTVVLQVEGGDQMVKTPWGDTRTGFSARGTISRKDYGMNWNKALDNGGVILGDDVKIEIEIEASQKK